MKSNKFKIEVIDTSKKPILEFNGSDYILNVDSLYYKTNLEKHKVKKYLNNTNLLTEKVNVCNLCSLCNRLGVLYNSEDCLTIVNRLIVILKDFNLGITQKNITNYGEIDCLPIKNLFTYLPEANKVIIYRFLLERFKLLGYVDSQLPQLFELTQDLSKLLPADELYNLCYENKETLEMYDKIKELFIW